MQTASTFSTSLRGTSLPAQQQRCRQARGSHLAPVGLFGRKSSTAVVEEPPAPVKRGLFGSKPAAPKQQPAAKKQPKKASTKVDKAAEYEQRQGFFGRAVSALDFAEVRSKSDAELLYEAKYGRRQEGGKMTREQYGALRRRVGGTAKDYWKDWVEVKGDYVDKGYVSKDRSATSANIPALPFLVLTVMALFGATFFVVTQTS